MRRREFIKTSGIAFAGLFSFPKNLFAKNGKLCVVLDDAGGSRSTISSLEKLAEKDMPVTVAVLPNSNYEKEALKILEHYKNSDILLHQQMEPINMIKRGLQNSLEANIRKKGEQFNKFKHAAIYEFDSPKDAEMIVDNNIKHLNNYLNKLNSNKKIIGLNNHMGSLITQKKDVMRKIAQYCINNNLVLLDSKTTHKSMMYNLGKIVGNELNVEKDISAKVYARNSNFLDKDSIEKLNKCNELAKKGNTVITIGHLQYSETVDAFIRFANNNYNILTRISKLE